MKKTYPIIGLFALVLIFSAMFPVFVQADHAWGTYHWGRTSNPFVLKIGDNVSSIWDGYLNTTLSDWSVSSVLDMTKVIGGTTAKRCRPTAGKVEVCNAKYGNNGWLGIAQIWVSGSHITQAVTKLNDTYFNKPAYNTIAWRNLVLCQEVGHTLGLDHQDENFNNLPLGTCMDYSSDPSLNQHPNVHDYEELELIYDHLDAVTTVSAMPTQMAQGDFSQVSDWGRSLKDNGKVALHERDFGQGRKVFTFVIWAQEGKGGRE